MRTIMTARNELENAVTPVVDKLGNSFSVRIPMHIAEKAEISAGQRIEISVGECGTIKMDKARPGCVLNELVKGITPENRHRLADWE